MGESHNEARRIAAIHEAGHAVAACMRGGSPFIAWAGCWAEARLAWGALSYDATDDDGNEWCDHLTGVFLSHRDHDSAVVVEHFKELAPDDGAALP